MVDEIADEFDCTCMPVRQAPLRLVIRAIRSKPMACANWLKVAITARNLFCNPMHSGGLLLDPRSARTRLHRPSNGQVRHFDEPSLKRFLEETLEDILVLGFSRANRFHQQMEVVPLVECC